MNIQRINTVGWILILPALLLMGIFYFLPVLQVLAISFIEPTPGFGNYELLATNSAVQRTIVTTLRIGIITTIASLFLGYILAYQISVCNPLARRWWLLIVLIPLWVSVLVRSFAWVMLLRRTGLINEALLNIGVINEPLAMIWNEFGIIIGMVHYMVPFAVLVMLSTMRDIDLKLLVAARGLGAGKTASFFLVFLPLSAPGIIGSGLLVFIMTLGFYITPALLGGGKTLMASEWIKNQVLGLVQWGPGAMLATVLVVGILLMLAIFSKVVDLKSVFGGR